MARRTGQANAVDPLHGGAVQVPRSRGAVSGLLLIALGAWGALVPLVGPAFGFGLSPDQSWHWTAARFWLQVLPGAVTLLGGVLLLLAANRITISLGAWLGVAGGAWFVVGTDLADLLGIGSPGTPMGHSKGLRALESLACFAGLGAAILFVSAAAVGRLSVRSVRDVRAAQRREAVAVAEQRREQAYQQARLREQDDTELAPGSSSGRGNTAPTPVTVTNLDALRQSPAPASGERTQTSGPLVQGRQAPPPNSQQYLDSQQYPAQPAPTRVSGSLDRGGSRGATQWRERR
jgi:hypothetical protein